MEMLEITIHIYIYIFVYIINIMLWVLLVSLNQFNPSHFYMDTYVQKNWRFQDGDKKKCVYGMFTDKKA